MRSKTVIHHYRSGPYFGQLKLNTDTYACEVYITRNGVKVAKYSDNCLYDGPKGMLYDHVEHLVNSLTH